MPSKPRPSLADRLRAHREEMELAMERRCSLTEARELIAQPKARKHWEETHARLQAKMNGQPLRSPENPESPPLPWWQRD